MGLLRFIPIKLTFFLVVGILIGQYLNIRLVPALLSTLIATCVLAASFLSKKRTDSIFFAAIAYVTVMCIGILALSVSQPKNRYDHYTKTNCYDSSLWHLKIREVLRPNTFSYRYIVDIHKKDALSASGKLSLMITKDTLGNSLRSPLEVDDELMAHIKIMPIKKPLNPHQFDYSAYLEKLGIYHEIRLQRDGIIVMENPGATILGVAAKARDHIISKLETTAFGKEELGIIKALLLGQRNTISKATYDDYKNAGAVHILAVSGLHIGILLLILQFILRPLERLPKGKNIKLLAILVLLWGFAFIAGLSASIIRAVTMFSFVAYALYLNRPSNTFNVLALSMFFVLLAIDARLIFQVGFQMSYAAVLFIAWVYPLLQKLWLPGNIIVRKIWQLLSVSVAAQLGVLPIGLFYFHQFPGLFFVSNLLIVPFLGFILGLGLLVILLSLINSLHPLVVYVYNFVIGTMNTVIGMVAEQETFLIKDIPFSSVQLFMSYVLIISFLLAVSKSTFKKWAVFLFAVIAFQSWAFYTAYQNKQKRELLVLHQKNNSLVLFRKGDKAAVGYKKENNHSKKTLADYRVGENVRYIEKKKLENSYRIGKKTLLIIDSLGVYPNETIEPDFLLLTQSPKIHLGRLIDSIAPKLIIADGNNYSSYIKRWRKTCAKRKLPFHYTGEKGAFVFRN